MSDQEGATVDIFYSIVKFFVEGGPFMLPILFVGAVGTAIAIERQSAPRSRSSVT
jgi:hypothetical protein